jgi:hypothetical protein
MKYVRTTMTAPKKKKRTKNKKGEKKKGQFTERIYSVSRKIEHIKELIQ